MAGLGEVCSHVAAVLFYLETASRVTGTSTCTQEKARWMIPSFQKAIPYLRMKDVDMSLKSKKKKTAADDTACSPVPLPICSKASSVSTKTSPTSQQSKLSTFYKSLSEAPSKPGILSLIPGYSDPYIPKSKTQHFPQLLQSLHDPKFLSLDYVQLLDVCEGVVLEVTEDMAAAVEEATRAQSKCNLWYKYRAGRVTASRLKQVCRTNLAMPSQSLVKSICYPEAFRFTSAATSWGCSHEKAAREHYMELSRNSHDNIVVEECGFVINPCWPHLGASPDGIVHCLCCGQGVIEIKCSYCHNNEEIDAVVDDPKSCLGRLPDGSVTLVKSHAYYYQVQMQIFVCNVEYCDFVLCTFPTSSYCPIPYDHDAYIHRNQIYNIFPGTSSNASSVMTSPTRINITVLARYPIISQKLQNNHLE